jgi:hypothetical protein
MSSADKMKQWFDEAAVRANAASDDAVFKKVKTAYIKTIQHESTQHRPSMWRFVMKSPLTKLAVAAAVIIACVIGLSLWKTTGSGVALADVLARVEGVKSFRLKGDFTIASEPVSGEPFHMEIHGEVLASQEWGRKTGTTYFQRQKKTLVEINHRSKTYTRTELDDPAFRRMEEGLVEDFDASFWLRQMMKSKYESLGRSTLDGVEVEGFHTTDPNCGAGSPLIDPQVDVKLWVDVKTRMPVRMESRTSGSMPMGGRTNNQSVLHDFQWDLPVTAADFEPPPVPEGYLVVVDKLPEPLTEEGAIQGLKQCVEWLGKYPGNLRGALPGGIQSELDRSDSPATVQLKDELKGLTEQDRVNRLMEAGTPLRRLRRFFTGLNLDGKDAAYYGRTVTPQDADKVLMRWKLSDSEYRIIYGDLHAETVSSERLAELEKAVPK